MVRNFEDTDAQAEFSETRNGFGRKIQRLTLIENGKPTRNAFFSLDQAIDQLHENFEFEVGKRYLIKYLTSQQYKAGEFFTYNNNTNIEDYAWSERDEQDKYGAEALDRDDLHVFAIIVEEVRPAN